MLEQKSKKSFWNLYSAVHNRYIVAQFQINQPHDFGEGAYIYIKEIWEEVKKSPMFSTCKSYRIR